MSTDDKQGDRPLAPESLAESLERQIEEGGADQDSDDAVRTRPVGLDDGSIPLSFDSDRKRPAPTTPPRYESGASMSRDMAAQQTLRGMLGAGGRALRRFPGLVASMYLVQLVLSAGAALVMGALLLRAFGHRPVFDQAMAGDLGALATSLGGHPGLITSLLLVGLGAALVYSVVSWFMVAGLIAVVLDPPHRRREVARWFGAGGAANLFPFLRLALWSALPQLVILALAGRGLAVVATAAPDMLTGGEVMGALARTLAAPLLLHWIVAAAIDLARIDLVRHPGMSSLRAFGRSFKLLVRRPVALVHTALYGLVFVGTLIAYVALGAGPVAGAGLGALFVVRQLSSLVRFAAHVGLIAGQVELSCTSQPSPSARRIA